MASVLYGVVKYFSPRGFGFIRWDNPQDLFFHISSFANPVATRDGVVFERLSRGESPRQPKIGDQVAFEVGRGERGPVAIPWCYTKDYGEALDRHNNWQKPPRYRVVVTYDQRHLIGGGVDATHVEWGGENGGTLQDLCKAYPRDRNDPLRYYGGDDFNRSSQIQVLVDGKWIDVTEDPRPVLPDSRYHRRW